MQSFARVIVEESRGRWSAWLSDTPEIGCCDFDLVDAIVELIVVCDDVIAFERIVALDEATREGHFEFLIQYRDRMRIPVPSLN